MSCDTGGVKLMRLKVSGCRGARPVFPNAGPNRKVRRKEAAEARSLNRLVRKLDSLNQRLGFAPPPSVRDRVWDERPGDADEWKRLADKS